MKISKQMYPTIEMVDGNVQSLVEDAIAVGQGVLHALPNFVHRDFCKPAQNLRLHPDDYYWLGAGLGFDERWFLSTMPAANTVKVDHEGLTFILCPNGQRVLLRDAVEARPTTIVGMAMYDSFRAWAAYSKFFDNMNALPHHSHQNDEAAARVGIKGKPESYFWPAEYNQYPTREGYTYFGLRPGTTRGQVLECLKAWGAGGSDIRYLSQAYKLRVDTGWLVPPGMLHAPGSLCTYEPQSHSDTFQMYQHATTDGALKRDELLFKDIPNDKKGDFEYMLDLLDWDLNLDPDFPRLYALTPRLDASRSHQGVRDEWVVYGRVHGAECFSAKKLTIAPGCETTLSDPGASGILFMNGRGTIGGHVIDVPSMFRVGDVTYDEFFISHYAAARTKIVNTGKTPLTSLRYFGPNCHGVDLPELND